MHHLHMLSDLGKIRADLPGSPGMSCGGGRGGGGEHSRSHVGPFRGHGLSSILKTESKVSSAWQIITACRNFTKKKIMMNYSRTVFTN